MVQISLFDLQPPPTPINGEAFALSPLDIIGFLPGSAAAKAGEKLTTGIVKPVTNIFESIGKFFAPKVVVAPASKGLATVSTRGSARYGGAPLSVSGGTSRTSVSQFLAPTVAPNSIKTGITLPKLFQGPVNSNLALVAGTAGASLGITGLLTQTEGGVNLVDKTAGTVSGVTNFISQNPLIVAGAVIVIGVMVLKR